MIADFPQSVAYWPPNSSPYFLWDASKNSETSLDEFKTSIRQFINPFELTFLAKSPRDELFADPLYNYPPLEYAIIKKDEESLQFLLNHELISDHYSISLIFFYVDCLKENLKPNLTILKLLLNYMPDINAKVYYHLQEGKTNILDFTIYHMASFRRLHMEVIEELFRRGARSSGEGAYSAFEQLKHQKFYSKSSILEVNEWVTDSEVTEVQRKEMYNRTLCRPSFFRHRIHIQHIPQKQTFFDKIKGRIFNRPDRVIDGKIAHRPIAYVSKNPCLKCLYHYSKKEKEYFPNAKTYLTTKKFGKRLSEVHNLIHCIEKIFSFCRNHEYILKPSKLELNELQLYQNELVKKCDKQPLSVWLIGKERNISESFKMNFSEYDSINKRFRKQTIISVLVGKKREHLILLERVLLLFFRSMKKHRKYFDELVQEEKFEDCFERKEVKNLTRVLGEIIKKFPFNSKKFYQEIGREAFQHFRFSDRSL